MATLRAMRSLTLEQQGLALQVLLLVARDEDETFLDDIPALSQEIRPRIRTDRLRNLWQHVGPVVAELLIELRHDRNRFVNKSAKNRANAKVRWSSLNANADANADAEEKREIRERTDPPLPPAHAVGVGVGAPCDVLRAPGTRAHPLDEDQATATANDAARHRATRWLERFTVTHQTRCGSPFVGKPSRDFEAAIRLVTAYAEDAALDALTDTYLSKPAAYDDGKPKTPGRLALLAPQLAVQRATAVQSRFGGWGDGCSHEPRCGQRSACLLRQAKAVAAGTLDLSRVDASMREEVERAATAYARPEPGSPTSRPAASSDPGGSACVDDERWPSRVAHLIGPDIGAELEPVRMRRVAGGAPCVS
ncbi:MAG: hypothetical protein IT182_03820 [Acidobacteria bacterium]|nr:hypothetical protein [Acidobacteriota bacterium]